MGGIGRAIDPTTTRGLANLATGGAYEASNAITGGKLGQMTGISGGGKGSGAPSAPDFAAAAQRADVSAHPNQTNAFGASSQWTQGADGQWTQQASMGGPLGGYAQGLQGQLDGSWRPGAVQSGSAARDQAIQGAYSQATSRLDPQWSQREESTRAQLANQGLDASSEAYGNAMGNFGRERNDAYSSAMNGAIAQGTAAGHTAFQDNLGAHQQETADHNLPLAQLGAVQGFTQQGQNPGGGQYLPAALAAYQGALGKYGADQAGKNSMMSGAASLAPYALAAL